jgi:hypothetical protein
MQLIVNYQKQLDLVRQNPDLLNDYQFDKDTPSSNHYQRLRLNIALYNDLQPSDYEIAKFLFMEESKWRTAPAPKDGEVDNLYFSAFILSLFKNPENIWIYHATKNIDFDGSIGFDGEYLVAAGIEKTYAYLETTDHIHKKNLLEYIGETADTCNYSQEEIDEWEVSTKNYFRCYNYPIDDEQYFLYSTDEKELFLAKLPEWINQPRSWTYAEINSFKTYATYSGDKSLRVKAAELAVEKDNNEFHFDINRRELATLYLEIDQREKALELLKSIISDTNNKNIIRDCLEQLCKIIIINKNNLDKISLNSFEIISKQQRKHGNFSPVVDSLISEVRSIFDR